jgi:hypothetical protein
MGIPMEKDNPKMRLLGLLTYLLLAVLLAGCSMFTTTHLADVEQQQQTVHEAEREKLWEYNRAWLLSRLPRAVEVAHQVKRALDDYPGNKNINSQDFTKADCEKIVDVMSHALSGYRFVRLPDGLGFFALIEGDAAYVFDIAHLEFCGVANLDKGLYFTVSDVPLERTDGRSFAFVADDKTDTTTVWFLYQRNILEVDQGKSLNLGMHSITRAELNVEGVAKQIDLLTPQQRGERELAKQGIVWLRRAQRKAVEVCSSQLEPKNEVPKHGDHGGRIGRHSSAAASEPTTAGSSTGFTNTMAEALQGKAHLNCSAGKGYVLTEDGIAAEVNRLVKSGDGFLDVIIAATAKEIPGGTMRYTYPSGQQQVNALGVEIGQDMVLEIESMKGNNKLSLSLRPDTGIGTGSLVLAGDLDGGSAYRILGKNLSNAEFALLFIRVYRDCAIKDSQGACKNIPDLFMSMLNPLIAQDIMQYMADNYLSGAERAKSRLNPR